MLECRPETAKPRCWKKDRDKAETGYLDIVVLSLTKSLHRVVKVNQNIHPITAQPFSLSGEFVHEEKAGLYILEPTAM